MMRTLLVLTAVTPILLLLNCVPQGIEIGLEPSPALTWTGMDEWNAGGVTNYYAISRAWGDDLV